MNIYEIYKEMAHVKDKQPKIQPVYKALGELINLPGPKNKYRFNRDEANRLKLPVHIYISKKTNRCIEEIKILDRLRVTKIDEIIRKNFQCAIYYNKLSKQQDLMIKSHKALLRIKERINEPLGMNSNFRKYIKVFTLVHSACIWVRGDSQLQIQNLLLDPKLCALLSIHFMRNDAKNFRISTPPKEIYSGDPTKHLPYFINVSDCDILDEQTGSKILSVLAKSEDQAVYIAYNTGKQWIPHHPYKDLDLPGHGCSIKRDHNNSLTFFDCNFGFFNFRDNAAFVFWFNIYRSFYTYYSFFLLYTYNSSCDLEIRPKGLAMRLKEESFIRIQKHAVYHKKEIHFYQLEAIKNLQPYVNCGKIIEQKSDRRDDLRTPLTLASGLKMLLPNKILTNLCGYIEQKYKEEVFDLLEDTDSIMKLYKQPNLFETEFQEYWENNFPLPFFFKITNYTEDFKREYHVRNFKSPYQHLMKKTEEFFYSYYLSDDDTKAKRLQQQVQIYERAKNSKLQISYIEPLIDKEKINVNEVITSSKKTLCHIVAKYSNTNCMRYLIDKGAKTNVRDANGRSPLDAAFESRKWNNAILIIRKGLGYGELKKAIIKAHGLQIIIDPIINPYIWSITPLTFICDKGNIMKTGSFSIAKTYLSQKNPPDKYLCLGQICLAQEKEGWIAAALTNFEKAVENDANKIQSIYCNCCILLIMDKKIPTKLLTSLKNFSKTKRRAKFFLLFIEQQKTKINSSMRSLINSMRSHIKTDFAQQTQDKGNFSYLLTGVLMAHFKQVKWAKVYFEISVISNSDNVIYLLIAAINLKKLGEYKQAMEYLYMAQQINPNSDDINKQLAATLRASIQGGKSIW